MDTSAEDTELSYLEPEQNVLEKAPKAKLISRNKLAIIFKTPSGETEYCCVLCPARYTEKEKLELHLCLHSKEYRYLCGICGTGLKRKEHLDRHTLEHQERRPHKCPDCGKAFKRKEHLNIHRTIHKGDKDQICTLCNRSFNRKDHLQKHLQTHSKMFSEQNMYPLDEQGLLELTGEQEFMEVAEPKIKEEIIIDDDIKAMSSDGSYLDYEMEGTDQQEMDNGQNGEYIVAEPCIDIRTPASNRDNKRPFICPVCQKSYKRKDHLKIHSWTHMKKEKTCTGCGKAFHTDAMLAAHRHTCVQAYTSTMQAYMQTEQPEDGTGEFNFNELVDNSLLVEARRGAKRDPECRPHECHICHRRFKRKQHLRVHANVHLKQEASIWCSLCNEGFWSNNQFERHQCRADATPEPAAKKENEYPDELFVQEMVEDPLGPPSPSTVADEQNIPVPQRVFVCRFCQKPFKRRDHYKIHLHIHTGVKDFFCPDCGKGFYRKDHLQKHSQTHAKQKPKPKKQLPDLLPINIALPPRVSLPPKKSGSQVKPEITITAPHNSKLRVPLQIKVPYQVVTAAADGSRRAVTVEPRL